MVDSLVAEMDELKKVSLSFMVLESLESQELCLKPCRSGTSGATFKAERYRLKLRRAKQRRRRARLLQNPVSARASGSESTSPGTRRADRGYDAAKREHC